VNPSHSPLSLRRRGGGGEVLKDTLTSLPREQTAMHIRTFVAMLSLTVFLGGGIVVAQTKAMLARRRAKPSPVFVDWTTATPESQGMVSAKLQALWNHLQASQTTTLLVIRNDQIVFERYAEGFSRTKPHSTASMAKALVGGMALMVAMNDRRIRPDDLA